MTRALRTAALKRAALPTANAARALLVEPGSDSPDDILTQVKALMAAPRLARSARLACERDSRARLP